MLSRHDNIILCIGIARYRCGQHMVLTRRETILLLHESFPGQLHLCKGIMNNLIGKVVGAICLIYYSIHNSVYFLKFISCLNCWTSFTFRSPTIIWSFVKATWTLNVYSELYQNQWNLLMSFLFALHNACYVLIR